jgi:dTDP-4-dehydrorhamnose reductase
MNIAITGQNGLLSTQLQCIDDSIKVLSSADYNINSNSILSKLDTIDFDTLIHAAAITKYNSEIATDIIQTNIIGTSYISQYCIKNNKRLVYISTDYVYPGLTGNYTEIDSVFPSNEYAWTKLGGECSVNLVPNHLIIRTSFGSEQFPYEFAWDNLITSKDYVDVIAPMIYKASISNITGTLNIGTEPKSMYEYALKRNKVKKDKLRYNKNYSLNLNKYEQSLID